jgi:excisionase family DNA binding protein
MNASEEWLTVQQAAVVRGVYWNSIYAAVRHGRLPAEKRDGRIRIRRADLEKWQPRGSRSMQRQPAQAIQEQCAAAAARIGTAPSLTIRQAARWKGIRPEQL